VHVDLLYVTFYFVCIMVQVFLFAIFWSTLFDTSLKVKAFLNQISKCMILQRYAELSRNQSCFRCTLIFFFLFVLGSASTGEQAPEAAYYENCRLCDVWNHCSRRLRNLAFPQGRHRVHPV
jgi:hypothetical protein